MAGGPRPDGPPTVSRGRHVSLEALRAEDAAQRLVDLSADVRCAVLVNPAGGLVSTSDGDRGRGRRLAGLAHDMVTAADAVWAGPTDAIEAQTLGGAIFVARDARYALACVARRLALPALVLYDLRQLLAAVHAQGPEANQSKGDSAPLCNLSPGVTPPDPQS